MLLLPLLVRRTGRGLPECPVPRRFQIALLCALRQVMQRNVPVGLACQFASGEPFSGKPNRLLQLLFVTGDDGQAFPATADCNVELLFRHPIPGDNDRIDGFTLTAVRGDDVAMIEGMVVRRQTAAVFELNPAVL